MPAKKKVGRGRPDICKDGIRTQIKKGERKNPKGSSAKAKLKKHMRDYIADGEPAKKWEEAVLKMVEKSRKGDVACFKALSEYMHEASSTASGDCRKTVVHQ